MMLGHLAKRFIISRHTLCIAQCGFNNLNNNNATSIIIINNQLKSYPIHNKRSLSTSNLRFSAAVIIIFLFKFIINL